MKILKRLFWKRKNAIDPYDRKNWVYLKEKFTIHVERDNVCMADAPDSCTLRVESVDDLAQQLRDRFLPRVAWDMTWIAHLLSRHGQVVFQLAIPAKGKVEIHELSDEKWFYDGVLLYLKFQPAKTNG